MRSSSRRLHAGYTPVIRRLYDGYTTVIRRLHDGYTRATRWLHDGYTTVTRRLYDGYTTVTRRLYDGYTTVTRWLHDGYTIAARVDEDKKQLKTVTRRLHAGYTTVIRRLYDGYTIAGSPPTRGGRLPSAAQDCRGPWQGRQREAWEARGGEGCGASQYAWPASRTRAPRGCGQSHACRGDHPAGAHCHARQNCSVLAVRPVHFMPLRDSAPQPTSPRGTRASPRHPRQPAPAHASSHHPRHVSHPLSCNRHVTVM